MRIINAKLSGVMLACIIIIVSFVYAVNIQPMVNGDPINYSYGLIRFSSYEDFSSFLGNCSSRNEYYSYGINGIPAAGMMLENMKSSAEWDSADNSIDFSETNIQVEGVDEPDVVKTDGTYIYLVSNSKVYIIKANPAEDSNIVAEISVDFTVSNVFINSDRLIVFGNSYSDPVYYDQENINICPWYSNSNTEIQVYDISDKNNPEIKREVVVGGYYYNARMIDNYVYIITTQNTYDLEPYDEKNNTIVPQINENGIVRPIPLEDICYIDMPSSSITLTHVVSINVDDDKEEVIDKIFTLGNSQNMYVSNNNIFIAYQINYNDYYIMQEILNEIVMPLVPEKIRLDIESARDFNIPDYQKTSVVQWILEAYYDYLDVDEKRDIENEIQKRIERTIIHKISVEQGAIEYVANGTVPGRVLNQFSMDEHDGFFRIATTIGHLSRSGIESSSNNIYILDENLDRISEIEDIAPGERIYSARFIGERAYLVTFKKIDPFFTIDLSDPYNPEILGELKIPGYSDYLHPYDQNHIIGIGKDTVESKSGGFAWYQGLKIALFDVSDFDNPKVVSQVIIGDRGTDSPVLYDHKAFLFDKEKELLVLPVNLYEISDEIKEENNGYTGSNRGEFKFQGAYVYRLNLEDGFEYKGRITHMTEEEMENSEYYYYGSSSVYRSLYIENVLYTFSNNLIKMNSVTDLSEINSITLL